jgi:hypothetical protein
VAPLSSASGGAWGKQGARVAFCLSPRSQPRRPLPSDCCDIDSGAGMSYSSPAALGVAFMLARVVDPRFGSGQVLRGGSSLRSARRGRSGLAMCWRLTRKDREGASAPVNPSDQ